MMSKERWQRGKEKRLEDTRRYRKGPIDNVIDEIGRWACFQDTNGEDFSDREAYEVEDDFRSAPVQTVV